MLVAVGLTGNSQLALSRFDESNNESTSSPASIAFQDKLERNVQCGYSVRAWDNQCTRCLGFNADYKQCRCSITPVRCLHRSRRYPRCELATTLKKDSSSKRLTNASSRSKRLSPPRGSKIVSAKKTDVKSETTKNKGPLTTIQVGSELQGLASLSMVRFILKVSLTSPSKRRLATAPRQTSNRNRKHWMQNRSLRPSSRSWTTGTRYLS